MRSERRNLGGASRLIPKLLSFVSSDVDTECWLWNGALSDTGYGQLVWDSKVRYAHRLSYEAFREPIPSGLQIDHLCRVRRCINPQHLEPVSQKVNILRGVSPPAANAGLTHCKYGHELAPDKVYRLTTRPGRICKICHDRRVRERLARNKQRRKA